MWDVAGRAGKRVGAISVPPSYPLRPVNGFVVGCMLTPPGEPAALPPEVAAEVGPFEVDAPAPRGLRATDPDYVARGLAYLDRLQAQTEQRTEVTLRLMRRPWDLLCMVHYAPDRLQHYFWQHVTAGEGALDRTLAAAVAKIYDSLDLAVGRLVDAAGEGTTVILVSDHGFGSKPDHAIYINRWLANRGLLRERPLWRLRRRMARKLLGRARRAGYDALDRMVDLGRSQAWAHTLEPGTAGIRINLAGRYPLGCVPEGVAYEALRDEIVAGLDNLRAPGGERVFTRVARREDVYRGPFVDEAPDVLALCADGFGVIYESVRRDLRSRGLFGSFDELGFTGTHHPEGLYLFAGAGVAARGEHREFPIEAIAPTALHLLGLAVPRDMEAPVCTSVFTEAFLRERPVELTDPTLPDDAAAAGWRSAEDEERVAAHLRALGYVE
jgi:predicted AlkP superfamily phosphohydrolase/phosphomutase